MSDTNAPENVELDAVKPEVLERYVLHNITRAIMKEASMCAEEVAPVALAKVLNVPVPEKDVTDMLERVMHHVSNMQEFAVLIEKFLPAEKPENDTDKKFIKDAIMVHPVIEEAIGIATETGKERLQRKVDSLKNVRNS